MYYMYMLSFRMDGILSRKIISLEISMQEQPKQPEQPHN